MPFTFHSNHASELGSLATTCLFVQASETNAAWVTENDSPVQLGILPTIPNSSEQEAAQKIIQELSPANTAILFTSDNNVAKDGCSISCSNIFIVSSARTIELYSSGEYAGTFRGSALPTQTVATSSAKTPPLFLTHIEDHSLPRSSRDILIKFFIPKKPVAFQDTLSLHWLVMQGALRTSKATTSTSTEMNADASTPPVSVSDSQDRQSTDTSSGSLHTLRPTGSSVPSFDVEKVRAMLGHMQIEALPQGAKNLMRTMEIQSRAMSLGMTNPAYTLNSGTAPPPQFIPTHLVQNPPDSSAFNPTAGSSTAPVYVTKTELDQLEERIMNSIEQRFKQLEERIIATIANSASKSHPE
ncbi:unnamed protein product [Mortierella alpina]